MVDTLHTLYIFLDEGGNFDFTSNGSRFFLLSCITTKRPFPINTVLDDYRYECIEYGLPQEYFHCAKDNRYVRKKVFGIIRNFIEDFRIDSLIIEKCKTATSLQDPKRFYAEMLGYLLHYVIKSQDKSNLKEVIVITDLLPINKQRWAVEKSIKQTLSEMLPMDIPYKLFHHASRSHFGLQVVDYCNWAILRKWEAGDLEYHNHIRSALFSEYDIFKHESTKYY